ncbi:MAG: peptidylprolyl isomerase [Candidatus Pacearchaeota archaeon]|nr:peptidylprolyl isomerase [Candidatus Pacearchaeota archaeon]
MDVEMKTKKGDFIEIDFSAYANGALFDTTREEDAKKIGIDIEKRKMSPVVVCIGEGMLLKGLDKELENKEIGKDYNVVLKPEAAFGKRDARLIKPVPLSAFKEKPYIGMLVNVEGIVAKVVSIAGGRALIDLNNPLAGKEIIYKFRINSIVNEDDKKIKAIARMFDIKIRKIDGNKVYIYDLKKIKKETLDFFIKKIKNLVGLEIEPISAERNE